MLKWDDLRTSQPSSLSTAVPEMIQRRCLMAQKVFSAWIPCYGAVLTLKAHIAQVKDCSEQFGDFPRVTLSEHEDFQSWTEVGVFRHIISSFAAGALTLVIQSHGLKLDVNACLAGLFVIFSPMSISVFDSHFSRIISVPWSDSCNQQRSQGKESFSAQLSCPSACSKRCGSFFPQAPAQGSTWALPQENLTCNMLRLLQIYS